MMRLCVDVTHRLEVDPKSNDVKCLRCPLLFKKTDIVIAQRAGQRLRDVVRRAERDWYIQELES